MYTEKPLQSITVKNIQEARSVLYGKFGHTYNIIKTKPVLKGGFLGFYQKEYLTVTLGWERPLSFAERETMQATAMRWHS